MGSRKREEGRPEKEDNNMNVGAWLALARGEGSKFSVHSSIQNRQSENGSRHTRYSVPRKQPLIPTTVFNSELQRQEKFRGNSLTNYLAISKNMQ